MVEKGWCRLIEKQLDSIWIWLNMIEMHLNTCKCVILCYPRSYCTMAFFKGDTSYKLTCPSTAPHDIHCPCHLLRQPLRPFDLYCTPHNNGCATSRWKKTWFRKDNTFIWGAYYSLAHGLGLYILVVLDGNSRDLKFAAAGNGSMRPQQNLTASGCWRTIRVRFPQIWLPISRWKPDFEIQKGSNMSYHVIFAMMVLYKSLQNIGPTTAVACCRCMSLYVVVAWWMLDPRSPSWKPLWWWSWRRWWLVK